MALHGGELRIYEPFAPKHKPAVADVAPIIDRLIIFYADYRVPHEVLPSHAELTLTLALSLTLTLTLTLTPFAPGRGGGVCVAV